MGANNILLNRLLALILVILLSPLLVLIGVLVKCTSIGPVFFTQERIGYKGKLIRLIKFRTMVPGALPLAKWNLGFRHQYDSRISSKFGLWLRQTGLDELPQLLNIVAGELNFVGPRPLPVYHLERFDTGFQKLRKSVRPGLTGWWQIHKNLDALESLKSFDVWYIHNRSIWLDAKILFLTIKGGVKCGNIKS